MKNKFFNGYDLDEIYHDTVGYFFKANMNILFIGDMDEWSLEVSDF